MTRISWSSSNQWITGAEDGTIKVWNAKNWELMISFISHSSPIVTLQAAAGSMSSLDQDGLLLTWSLKSGEITGENRHLMRQGASLLIF